MNPKGALIEIERLVEQANQHTLAPNQCLRLAGLTSIVPGRLEVAAKTLVKQGTASAVDALLQLPQDHACRREGIAKTIAQGVCRETESGDSFPRMLALEFRTSRSPNFPRLLQRAQASFGPALAPLKTPRHLIYRILFHFGDPQWKTTRSLTIPRLPTDELQSLLAEFLWLLPRLIRFRGTQLWINGWCFSSDGPLSSGDLIYFASSWTGQLGRSTQAPIEMR